MKSTATSTLVYLLLFSFFVLSGCKKDTQDPEDLLQRWQVISMRRPNSALQQYPAGTYILHFKTKRQLAFKLDVNNCEGDYTVSRPGTIKINYLGCTEICCDSDIAQELASFLHHVKDYTIEEKILTLNGIGQIKLKRLE